MSWHSRFALAAAFFMLAMNPGAARALDNDEDGIPDDSDNCPGIANSNQADADQDGAGDVCDCPESARLPSVPDPDPNAPPNTSPWLGSQCSPDVAITTAVDQQENSVFIDPLHSGIVLNSNNSDLAQLTAVQGADHFLTTNGGRTWQGSTSGVAGANMGDPSAAIDRNGRLYVGHMSGTGASKSLDVAAADLAVYPDQLGASFTDVPAQGLGDKPHLWLDNAPTSPHVGNLYLAWDAGGGLIRGSRLIAGEVEWSFLPVSISDINHLGSGVNLQTSSAGHLYALWKNTHFLAFNRSTTAPPGNSWAGASFVQQGIAMIPDFPSMTVDTTSGKPTSGTIYAVWDQGVPGDPDNDVDIYVSKSTNEGMTWSTPKRVNQDLAGNGKDQRRPWIAADPADGTLVCIFYDSRNSLVGSDSSEVFVALSKDGGETWRDFPVSDESFSSYWVTARGNDYIGIDIQDGRVYPVWTDQRDGTSYPLAYASPFVIDGGDRDVDGIPDDANSNDGQAPNRNQAPGGDPCRNGNTAGCDDNCPLTSNPDQADSDGDGVGDLCDDCTLAANAPPWPYVGAAAQLDADIDGYGNICDADFNQDDVVSNPDYLTLGGCYSDPVGTPGPAADPECRESDLDGDGVTALPDYLLFGMSYGLPPGPSGLACASTSPTSPCAAR